MSCTACYEASVQACGDIKIKAGLAATTEYYAIVTRPDRTSTYQRLLTTDGDGILTIAKADFPPGYFTPGNFYRITLRKGDNYPTIQKMTFSAVEYDCVTVQLVDIDTAEDDSSPIDTVQ